MRVMCATALAVALLASPVASRATVALVEGVGAGSCNDLAEMFRMDSKLAERMYGSWAMGYMSGLNALLSHNNRVWNEHGYTDLGKRPAAGQFMFLRLYCDKHPLGYIIQAVEALYDDMRIEQRLPDWRTELPQ